MAPQAFQLPQPFSLNGLLRQHCRDRLYIQPLHWTAQHLQLLGCRFVRRQRTPQPASSTQVDKQDTDLEDAVRRLTCGRDVEYKLSGVVDLLHALSNDPIDTSLPDRLYFYYAGRQVAKLHCYVFGRIIDDIPTPFLACADHSEVARSREKSISTPRWRNRPVWRIREANLARLQPTNIDQDPYLASILIALAQAQQHAHSYNTTARPSSYTVHLLVTNSSKGGFLRVYTATITAAFLLKLDQPSVFSDSSLIIRYASISMSDVKQEIAAILEPSKMKKHLRESVIIEQVACKRKKELGDGSRGGDSIDRQLGLSQVGQHE